MEAFGDFEPEWAIEDPFGDPTEDDDDDEPDNQNRDATHFGAEHLLFLFDCEDSMFERYVSCLSEDDPNNVDDDDDDERMPNFVSPIDVAVTAAHRFMRMKIREVAETKSGKRDAMGVLLYGCDPNRALRADGDGDCPESPGSGDDSEEETEELPTTEELIELHPPGGEQVLKIQDCLPPGNDNPNQEQRNLRKEYSRGKSREENGEENEDIVCSLLQGLTAAMKTFANSKCVKNPTPSSKQLPDSKAVWIFTNKDDPCHGNENQKSRMKTLKRDCQEANITINVMPLPKNAKEGEEKSEFDQNIFYNDITPPYNRVEDTDSFADSDGAVDIEDILSNFGVALRKKRKYATVPLLLPGWKERDNPGIMLDLFGLVQVRNKPQKFAVHQENNKMTIKKTKRYIEDTGEAVEPEDMHHYANFCGRVSVHPADLSKMKKASNSTDEAGLVLLGFRSTKSLPITNLMARSVLAFPNDARVNGSGKALYNLKQSMRKKDVYGVGELLLRASATSKMVALVPRNDEFCGFLIIHLPFKEDTRKVNQSEIGFADRNSVDAAKSLISKSTLQFEDFASSLPENPWLKHFFGYLESVSLGRPLGEVEDDAKMDVEQMLENAREEIVSFSLSLPEDDQPVKTERKRKALSSSKPEFVKESICEEWIDRYKNDEVADCTAIKLKDFLKSQGERVAGKKTDLVDRVHRVIQNKLFND